jgi:2-methylfumaryl-CoA hydratase
MTGGNFFEDFRLGQVFDHAPSRKLTEGDAAVYKAIYGSLFERETLDELLVFHTVFGMSVRDISLNAVANLGYAECVFGRPVLPGTRLNAVSTVIGLKENSDRKTGIVYVRTKGFGDGGVDVLSYARWVMVRKRDEAAAAPETVVPELARAVAAPRAPGDGRFQAGQRIDHVDGTTIEEAEHAMATRLFNNTAKVHFNQFTESKGRFGRRLVYGGHVISIARALSFNGLEGTRIAAINGGRHTAPVFAGDTIFAWSEVLDVQGGALRLRTIATKDLPCDAFPDKDGVVLDLDYWAVADR